MIQVRCCCEPSNLVGYLPPDSGLELMTYVEDGKEIPAYSSHGLTLEALKKKSGFRPAKKKRKPKKKGTWKE